MDNVLAGNEWSSDAAEMTARVVADAKRVYRDMADEGALERCARQAVAELWHHPIKVTAFVPVLALRRVRDVLADAGSTVLANSDVVFTSRGDPSTSAPRIAGPSDRPNASE